MGSVLGVRHCEYSKKRASGMDSHAPIPLARLNRFVLEDM